MEINTIESRLVPVKPKVIQNEQIEIYVPTANYNYPGMASFDSKGFIVDINGKVKLRRNPLRNVSNFTMDPTTGIGKIYYDDGTTSEISFPITTNNLYQRTALITIIDIVPNSFVYDEDTTYYLAAFPSSVTGFNDSKFLASFEELTYKTNEEGYPVKGYYTISDTIYKGDDGSILISIEKPEDAIKFQGRLVLLGGEVFSDNQVVSITYNPEVQSITILKTDGSREFIPTITEQYLEEYVNTKLTTVYKIRGSTSYADLPTYEELQTGEYLGYVYNINEDFRANDNRFKSDEYGKQYTSGTNIVVISVKNADSQDVYLFDVLGSAGSMVNLDDYISNQGGTINGSLIFNGVSDNTYSIIDANKLKLVNSTKDLSINLSNITLYDVGTSTYTYIDYPTQSGRLIVDTDLEDYVKFTDYATTTTAGVAKINNAFGIRINNAGELYLDTSNDIEIANQQGNTAIKVDQIPQAVKSGLVKHDNITLTDEEKTSACDWLGAVKIVTGLSTYPQVYAKYADGAQGMYNIAQEVVGNGIVQRLNDGFILTPTVTATSNVNYVVNKNYVDNNFIFKVTTVTSYDQVYAKSKNGISTILYDIDYSNSANSQYLVKRDIAGAVYIPDSAIGRTDYNFTAGQEAVNKKYVDNAIKLYRHRITLSTTGYRAVVEIINRRSEDYNDITSLYEYLQATNAPIIAHGYVLSDDDIVVNSVLEIGPGPSNTEIEITGVAEGGQYASQILDGIDSDSVSEI